MNRNYLILSLAGMLVLGTNNLFAGRIDLCNEQYIQMKEKTDNDPIKVKKLQDLLRRYAKDKPGFTFMAKYDSGTCYSGAVGMARLTPKRSMQVNDVFNLASVSKQFTAFAILLLERDKKLSLDDSIYKFMPELGEYVKGIKISNLIYHTSGLSDYMELAEAKGLGVESALTSEESLRHLAELTKTEFIPGSKHSYSNTGYFLLAQIIQKVSGQSIKEFSRTHIFEPLGMKNTFIVDHYPIERKYVLPYDKSGNMVEIIWNHTGDGAVHSNVHDLMLWGENMSTGKVGGRAIIQKFSTPLKPTTENGDSVLDYSPYGFGIEISKLENIDVLEHSGGWATYGTNFIRIPNMGLTIAVLCNSEEIDAINISHEIAKIIIS